MELMQRRRGLMQPQGYEVVWNQLLTSDDIPERTQFGITYKIEDHKVSFSGTISGGIVAFNLAPLVMVVNAHKYIAVTNIPITSTSINSLLVAENTYWSISLRPNISINTSNASVTSSVKLRLDTDTFDYHYVRFHMFDLTLLFGSGNEPSTAEQFRAWLLENNINPDSYIPYDAGTTRKMTKPSWIL